MSRFDHREPLAAEIDSILQQFLRDFITVSFIAHAAVGAIAFIATGHIEWLAMTLFAGHIAAKRFD